MMMDLTKRMGDMKEGAIHHSDEVGVAPIKDETAQGLPIHKEQGKQC